MATVYDPLTQSRVPTKKVINPLTDPIDEQGILGPSLKRVGGYLAQGAGTLYEDVTGNETDLNEYGQELARLNASPVQSLSDIPEDPLRFVGEQASEQVGQLGATGVGALVGGTIGQLVGGAGGRRLGVTLGSLAPSVIQSYGGIRQHTDDVGRAAVAALASGAVERFTGLERTAGDLIDKSAFIPDGRGILSNAARQAAQSVTVEAPTEVAQTAIERAGGEQALTGPQALHEYAMSAAAATAGAAPTGAALGAVMPREQANKAAQDAEPDSEQTGGALPVPAGGPADGPAGVIGDGAPDASQTPAPKTQIPARSYTQWAGMVNDDWLERAAQSMNAPMREAAADLRVARNNTLDGSDREQAAERAADVLRGVHGAGLNQQPPDLRDQGPLEAALRRSGMHGATMDRVEPEQEEQQGPAGVMGSEPIDGERVQPNGQPRSDADIEGEAAESIAGMQLTPEQAAQAQERLRQMGYASTVEDHPSAQGKKSVRVTLPARDSQGERAQRLDAQQPQLPRQQGQLADQSDGNSGGAAQPPYTTENERGLNEGSALSKPVPPGQTLRDMGAAPGETFETDAPLGPIAQGTPLRVVASTDETATVVDESSGDVTTLSRAEVEQARDTGAAAATTRSPNADKWDSLTQDEKRSLVPAHFADEQKDHAAESSWDGLRSGIRSVVSPDLYRMNAPAESDETATPTATPLAEDADAATGEPQLNEELRAGRISVDDYLRARGVDSDAFTDAKIGGQVKAEPTEYESAMDAAIEYAEQQAAKIKKPTKQNQGAMRLYNQRRQRWQTAAQGLRTAKKGQKNPFASDLLDLRELPASIEKRFGKTIRASVGTAREQGEQSRVESVIRYADEQTAGQPQEPSEPAESAPAAQASESPSDVFTWQDEQGGDEQTLNVTHVPRISQASVRKSGNGPYPWAAHITYEDGSTSTRDGFTTDDQAKRHVEAMARDANRWDETATSGRAVEATGAWVESPDIADQYDRDVSDVAGVQSASVTEEDAGVWQPVVSYDTGTMMLETQPTREAAQQAVDAELAEHANASTPASPPQPAARSPYKAPSGSTQHPIFRKTVDLIADIKAIAARADIDNAPDDSDATTIMQVLTRRLGEAQLDTLNAELDRISVGPATETRTAGPENTEPSAADTPTQEPEATAPEPPREQAAEDKQQRREVERELFNRLATIDAITTIVEDPQFIAKAHEIVRQTIEAEAVVADGRGDAERSQALRDALPDRNDFEFYRALQDEARKAAQEAGAERGKSPDVRNEALAGAMATAGVTPGTDDGEAFTRGFDHAVAKRTRSTLPQDSERAQDFARQGFDAGNAWLGTEAGANYASGGKRKRKLTNTGADLQRWFDKQLDAAENAEGDAATRDKLLKATSRSKLFPIEDNPDATPGTAAFIEKIRKTIATFTMFVEARHVERFGFTRRGKRAITESSFDNEGLEALANEYARAVISLHDAVAGATSVWEVSRGVVHFALTTPEDWERYENVLTEIENAGGLIVTTPADDDTEGRHRMSFMEWGELRQQVNHADAFTQDAERLIHIRQKGTWSSFMPGGFSLESFGTNENTITRQGQGGRATPMKRPKTQKVDRTGMPDRRNGRDVTPQEMKDTFAFADVGFGEWVGAERDQEHLNNSYDAFYDLAEFLGLGPRAMGFYGELHFTIGALGHGRHAAHYSPNQPHPDGGTVPVINVTNTHGDGSVAHEWSHALDYYLSRNSEGRDEVRAGYRMLRESMAVDPEAARDRLASFYKGHSQIVSRRGKFRKSKGAADNIEEGARYYITRPTTTGYKTEADKLGKDYWGNDRELWARAFESWVADNLPGVSNYLVNKDWVSDGAVTNPPYRGTPYPRGEERTRFNHMFREFAASLRATDGVIAAGTTLQDMRQSEREQRRQTFNDAQQYWLDQLERDAEEERDERRRATEEAEGAAAREQQRQAEARARAERDLHERGDTERTHTSTMGEPSLDDLDRMSDDEIDALVEGARAQVHEGNQETPDEPTPGETTVLAGSGDVDTQGNPAPQGPVQKGAAKNETIGSLSKEFAKHGINSIDEALRGLNELFGGNNLRSFPGGVDPDTYAKAKPHFEAMWGEAKAAGRTLTELARLIINTWGDGVAPYVKHWMKERRRGNVGASGEEPTDVANGNGGTGEEPLETVAPESLREYEGQGNAGRGNAGGSRPDATGNGRTEAGGADRDPGVGSGQEPVRSGRPGAGRRGDRGEPEGLGSWGDAPNPEPSVDSPSEIPQGNSQPPGRANTPALAGTNPGNYHITDADRIGTGTRGERIDANIAAIETVKRLQAEGRFATPEEQATMVKYVGWGGLKRVFQIDDKSTAQDRRANERLRELLTEEQFAAAQRSILDAHYTSPDVVRSLYRVINFMGINSGRSLEPSVGTGNFIGLMPADMATGSRIDAVELDDISASLASFTYPESQIIHKPYQDANLPYAGYDLVVGNPPFGDRPITDNNKRRKEISGLTIHNYFLAKSAMHLKPGGIMGVVVTNRFLDKPHSKGRDYLAENLQFLGAIRLPNTAFAENAGTEVTTDLVFFRKPVEHGEIDKAPAWADVVSFQNEDGETVKANEYFAERPHMMLGKPTMRGTMYGTGPQFTLEAPAGLNVGEAISRILETEFEGMADIAAARPDQAANVTATEYRADLQDLNIGGFALADGGVVQRLDDDEQGNPVYRTLTATTQWTPKTQLGKTRLDRIRGVLEIRQAAYDLMTAERTDAPNIEDLRADLNKRYDAFVARYGYVNDNANASLFSEDVRVEFGLEKDYKPAISRQRAKALKTEPRKASAKKSSLLNSRVNFPLQSVENVASAVDGYVVSMQEKGTVDLAYIARIYGKAESAVVDELSAGDKPYIYHDPLSQRWVAHDEYLSGNVKKKLRAVDGLDGYEKNVAVLREVLPVDVPADQINANFGATWIPHDVYETFAEDIGISQPNVAVVTTLGIVTIKSHGRVNSSGEYAKFNGGGSNQADVFNKLASGKQLVVRFTDQETGRSMVDQQGTNELRQAGEEVAGFFRDWVMAEPGRATRLTHLYNETMNTTVERQYDGAMLRMVGVNPDIDMRDTQLSAAWRMVQSKRTLLDHVVGAGKTFTVIMGIMERRRMGLTRKPLVVVPNHKVGDWAADFIKVYPGANILAASNKDFQKQNRRRLFARIAAGDYDAIIIGHSSFNFIPMLPENEARFMREQIALLEQAAEVMDGAEDSGTKRTVRNLENSKAKLEERVKKLLDEPRDPVATIEEMGIDSITIDESQEFKNLMISTSMTNIAGMGNLAGSKKALALFMRLRQIQQKGGSTYFATGTPISNTMTEMYTVLRYLNYEGLQDRQLTAFDAWAHAHASVEERVEMGAGGKFKQRRVMATFQNMPELMQLYNEFADVVTMADLKRQYTVQMERQNAERGADEPTDFPVPEVEHGGRVLNLADPNPLQEEYSEYLRARAEALQQPGNDIDPSVDNMLLVITDSRKMSMDIRMADPNGTDFDNNKTSRSAREIKRIYDKWDKDKGAQLVFSDLGTPLKHARDNSGKTIKAMIRRLPKEQQQIVTQMTASMEPMDAGDLIVERMRQLIESADGLDATLEKINKYLDEGVQEDMALLQTVRAGFSVYDDLRDKLIDAGIPENEIAYIHDYNTPKQKAELYDLVNSGRIRVLMGSTPKMGAGTNVQERLVGLHHLDAPWRPSDVEQREGRIIRQGNVLYERDPEGFSVEIIAYSTERTLDSMMWQTLARKQEMLGAFRNATAREMEDVYDDGAGFADFMAESTGNPVFKEQAQLKIEVKDLRSRERRVQAQRSGAERTVKNAPGWIEKYEHEAEALRAVTDKMQGAKSSDITLPNGDTIKADYKDALAAAEAAYRKKISEYEEKTRRYADALAAREKENPAERGDKPSEPKNRPTRPTPYQVAKKSSEAKFYVDLAGEISDAAESGSAKSQQYEVAGVSIEVEFTPARVPNKEAPLSGGMVTIKFGDADEFEVRPTSLVRRLIEHSQPATAVDDLRANASTQETMAAQRKREFKEAQATLDKMTFDRADRLAEVEARLDNATAEIESIEAEMRAKAQQSNNRYMDGKAHLRFSRAGTHTFGMRVDALRRALRGVFGQGVARMERDGALNLVQSDRDLPAEARGKGARGVVIDSDGDGKPRVYLVADNLNADNLKGVFLHEVGVHFGMRDMLGEDTFNNVMDRMAGLHRVGNEAVRAAFAKVPDHTPASLRNEEALGYLVESSPQLPFVRRIVSRLRVFLFQAFGIGGNSLTTDDMVTLAQASASRAARAREQAQNDTDGGTGKWVQPLYSISATIDGAGEYEIDPEDQARVEALRRSGLLWSTLTPRERMTQSLTDKWEAFKDNVLARWREGLFDQFAPIKAAEGDVTAEQSGYLSARLSTGASSTMYASLLYGAPEWKNGIVSKKDGTHGLLTILDPIKGELNEWLGWMVAQRAQYLAEQGRENNMRPEDIAELTNGIDGERLKRYEDIAKQFREYNTDLLRMARDAGILTDAQVKAFQRDRYYVPFYRVDDSDPEYTPTFAFTNNGLSHQKSGIEQLKGGSQAISDPLQNVFTNMQRLIDASLKNQAMRQTVNNTKHLLTPEPEGNRGDPDVVRVMDNGDAHYYRVSDPALLRAMVGINDQPIPGLGAFRAVKRLLTASITADPAFIVRNFARDMLSAWMMDKNQFRFGIDSMRGAKDTLRSLRNQDEADVGLQAIMFAGASFVGGHAYGDDPATYANALRRALRAKGLTPEASNNFMDSIVDRPAKWWSAYRELGDAAENANRMAVYRSATNNNRTPLESVYEAKDLMDFSLRGNFMFMRVMSDMLPFFNARIQGLYKLGRRASEDPKQLAGRGLMVMGASLALAAANAGNPDYEELPGWDKDLYWHIFLPGGAHLRIPKPFELGVLFATMPERMYRLATGADSTDQTLDSMVRQLGQILALDPTPQLISPALEVYMNWDKFRNRPIENIGDQGRLPEARFSAYTSPTMVEIGQLLNYSPKKLEHLWNGYLGTMGTYALGIADFIVRRLQGDVLPSKTINDIPILNDFVRGDAPARSTAWADEFYSLLNEANQVYSAINKYRDTGQREQARELYQDNQQLMAARGRLTSAQRKAGDIRDRMSTLYRDTSVSPEVKRERLDSMQRMLNRVMKNVAESADEIA